MRVLKSDSIKEKAVQEVEEVLRRQGISIEIGPGVLEVHFEDGCQCHISDTDFPHQYVGLPRTVESERLIIEE